MGKRHVRTLERLVAARDDVDLVRLERRDGDDVEKYVVGLGREWVLLAVLDDTIVLDEHAVLRISDVRGVRRRSRGDMAQRALELRQQWPPAAPQYSIDLEDLRSLLASLSNEPRDGLPRAGRARRLLHRRAHRGRGPVRAGAAQRCWTETMRARQGTRPVVPQVLTALPVRRVLWWGLVAVLVSGCSEQVTEETVAHLRSFDGSPLLDPPARSSDEDRYLSTPCVDPGSPEAPVNGVRFERSSLLDAVQVVDVYSEKAVADGWGLFSRERSGENGSYAEAERVKAAYYRKDLGDWIAEFSVTSYPDRTTYLELKHRSPVDYC